MLNVVILQGRFGKDPEMRYTPTGKAVVKAPIAVSRRYTGADGEKVEKTTWVNIEAWGRTAETINEYFQKGTMIIVRGRLEIDEYEQDGVKKYFTKVVVESFEFDGPKPATADEDTTLFEE